MLNSNLLDQLSDRFLNDLRASQYYLGLSDREKNELEQRLNRDIAKGNRPLLPGADPADIKLVKELAQKELKTNLPPEITDILSEVDGFSENGVCLYGADQEPPDEGTYATTYATIVAENLSLWDGEPTLSDKYLFLGDSELSYFTFHLSTKQSISLSRASLEPDLTYRSLEDMVNHMLTLALSESSLTTSR